jgi:hypothetical protein
MTPPWNKDINRYIGKFKEIQKAFRTYDAHVHPTENPGAVRPAVTDAECRRKEVFRDED